MMAIHGRSHMEIDKQRRAQLRTFRKALGLKQEELAVLAGVSPEMVARFERCKHVSRIVETKRIQAELVLVSSPPGFCVQGSVVYCKKLPSDDYILGIRLDVPVEHWVEALGLRGVLTNFDLSRG